MTNSWQDLAARCEGADPTGPIWEIDGDMAPLVGFRARMPWTADMNRIVALIEERLPGRPWDVARDPYIERGIYRGRVGTLVCGKGWMRVHGFAATPALALCAAFCRAMAERGRS